MLPYCRTYADVEEIRAAAEAEAAAAARTAALDAHLANVAAWNPAAAEILEARLAAAVDDMAAVAEAAKDPAVAAALAEERALVAAALRDDSPDLLDAIMAGAAGRPLPALTAPEAPEAADAAAAAAAAPDGASANMDALMESLPRLTAEAQWQATPLGEMPPNVLAEALAATAVELGEAGMLSEKDRVRGRGGAGRESARGPLGLQEADGCTCGGGTQCFALEGPPCLFRYHATTTLRGSCAARSVLPFELSTAPYANNKEHRVRYIPRPSLTHRFCLRKWRARRSCCALRHLHTRAHALIHTP